MKNIRLIFGLALLAASGLRVAPAQDAAEFKITSVRLSDDGATVALKFDSQIGTIYRVETSPSLGAGTWADAGVSAVGDGGERGFDIPTTGLGGTHFFRVSAATATPTGFSWIPGGAFTMGRTSGDTDKDAPPVSVTVSAFYMGKYEVTKALWDEVRMSALANGYAFDNIGGGKASDHPVHTVSWYDVVKWCNARSEREGLTPCYTVAGVPYRIGNIAPVCNWGASGYRLPSEAEWEKAARGGASGARYPWGTDTISHSQANYRGNGPNYGNLSVNAFYHPTYNDGITPYSSPVGSFAANGYGLYDMAGNMFEFCWDWYSENYYTSGATDPHGPSSGTFVVARGGGWTPNNVHCRAASRGYYYRDEPSYTQGFRLARSSVP